MDLPFPWTKIDEQFIGCVPDRDRSEPHIQALREVGYYQLHTDRNFTSLVLLCRGVVTIGVAKRNPTDPVNPDLAARIAMIRAYRNFKLYRVEVKDEAGRAAV